MAASAGVSPTTVSNLLNGRDGRMLPRTRQRILRAISELGYQPNLVARQLRTGEVRTIGLVVPSVANPFWGGFARAVERETLQHDYQILLCNSERDPARERAYVDELWSSGVRTVIIGSSLPSLEHLEHAMQRGLLLIAFDRESQPDDPPGLVTVSVDNRLGGLLATRHLLSLGHRRIGFISGAIATVSRRQRLAGYREALGDSGIPFSEELVWANGGEQGFGDVDSSGRGELGMRALLRLQHPPTAVVTINDMYAIGACAAAREESMRVPEDVSVVGFDDIVLAGLFNPPLTTVRQPLQEMARYAIDIVRERGHDEDQAASVVMAPRLVTRESTSPLPEHLDA
ncbi:MAG TPA: LacI family DNA-binding transcriptional regulator [Candidatus Dormibacteraeota bacterium]|nr:LacI family DNA-binding transcriptional regulator [Candidatus Dormibacteraeota bacterium]